MRILLLFTSFLITFCFYAQVKKDTVIVETKDTIHSPKKAIFYSAIVPGAGQIYNHIAMPKGKKKAYWKVPLIYAGLGATTYFAIENNKVKKAAQTEYRFREDNPGDIENPAFENLTLDGILSTYNLRIRNRDLMIFGAIIVYGLNILDAGVEAHFVNFDVTNDLSLHIQPTMLNSNTLGMHLSFKFR